MFIAEVITGMAAGGMVSAVLICAVTAESRAERSMEHEDMETGYSAGAGAVGCLVWRKGCR